ncbi:MAG: cupin domain-containing protein [Verrucomicrobiota bacterium]|nr:cupin domain-containing protein [Verrucomicrobiota bacterium]
MKKINLRDIAEDERHSPKGKYQRFQKEISVALGRDPKSPDLGQRHPFDLALERIPPGKSYCPYHAESAQWELYLVVSGSGAVRDASGTTEVSAGDAFLFKPGEAHQLSCAGEEDFVYYVIADNPIGDSCYYPDSGKFAVRKEGDETVIVNAQETDYFDGEE